MKKYISPSAIKIYNICPRAYYYYINGYVGEILYPEAIERGTIIHDIIREYYTELINTRRYYPSENEIRSILSSIVNSRNDINDDIKRLLRNFYSFELYRSMEWMVKPVAVEKEMVNEELGIHGILDVVYQKNNGKHIVLDWKTGVSSTVFNPDIIIQLSLYAILLNTDEAYIVNLDIDNPRPQRVSIDKSYVITLINIIKNDRDYLPVKKNCRNCPFNIICKTRINDELELEVVEE